MSQSNIQESKYTASDALNDALIRAGVSHIFLNTGSDYPPIIESWAKYEALGLPKPEIIISPNELVALSAAQGFTQATGRPQAVFVHVDVGTQNLGVLFTMPTGAVCLCSYWRDSLPTQWKEKLRVVGIPMCSLFKIRAIKQGLSGGTRNSTVN